MENIEKLRGLIERTDNIVFFGGAGVSTESSIPDFRSADGLYNQQFPYPPEVMLSHSFFRANTAEFFDFYRKKMIFPHAKPNAAHLALAALERAGRLRGVITQNIDGLHQLAGSKNVLELHGSVLRNYCTSCRRAHPLSAVTDCEGVPRCACGGVIKPDVVLYEEPLEHGVMERAVALLRAAELLIVGGTSLVVYPAAGLIDFFGGRDIVLINRDETPYDSRASLVIHDSVGKVLSGACAEYM